MRRLSAILLAATAVASSSAVFSSETSSPQAEPAAAPAGAEAPAGAKRASPEPAGKLQPPRPPAHARRNLDTATELSRDLQEVVTYLEAGQSYYRAYSKGTHSVEENQAFLQFLEAYEKEQAIARKESDALRKWVSEKAALETALQP